MDGLSNRLNTAEDRNGELKHQFQEITRNRPQRKYEREAKRYTVCKALRLPEGKTRDNGGEATFENIRAENFPEQTKNPNPQIPEAQ